MTGFRSGGCWQYLLALPLVAHALLARRRVLRPGLLCGDRRQSGPACWELQACLRAGMYDAGTLILWPVGWPVATSWRLPLFPAAPAAVGQAPRARTSRSFSACASMRRADSQMDISENAFVRVLTDLSRFVISNAASVESPMEPRNQSACKNASMRQCMATQLACEILKSYY